MPSIHDDFLLDPTVTFLNHGSFGATPKPVFDQYQHWQRVLEFQPVEFLGRKATLLLEESRSQLAAFLGAETNNLVYCTNVTEALNIVAHSLNLAAGDEVLTTNMEYGAMNRMWKLLSQKKGFRYITHPLELPLTDAQSYVEDFWRSVTPRTKVIFISHISSPTAAIAPVELICTRARAHGILTIIDGAHAPGHIELDISHIGADFYAANLHKWLCAPKGAGFLHAQPNVQHLVEPLIVSWGWEAEIPGPSRFIDYLQWTGTRDISAFLTVPTAIKYQKERNWSTYRQSGHALAARALQHISQWSRVAPLYAPGSNWFGQMVSCPLPNHADCTQLKQDLYEQYRIEVPILAWEQYKLVRVSFQAYNSEHDLEKLLLALSGLVK